MFKLKIESDKIFYFCYILLFMENMFSMVPIVNKILNFLGNLTLIVLVFYIIYINRKCEKSTFIKILIYLFFAAITAIVAKNKLLLKILLIIMAFKDIDFEDFTKKDFICRAIFVFFIILLNIFGIIESNNIFRNNGTIRYSLGFFHTNILGLHTLILCLEYLYINRKDVKTKQFIAVIITLLFNIFITDSRACIVSLLLVIAYLCFSNENLSKIYNNPKCKFLIKNSYTIIMIAMIILSLSFSAKNILFRKMDVLLSGRLYAANYYVNNYSILKPFGQYIEILDNIKSENFLALDIGYIHILVIFGPIMIALFFYMFYVTFKRLYKNKNYTLISIFIIWAVYSLIETNALYDIYNPFLIVLSVFFYSYIKGIDNNLRLKKQRDKLERDSYEILKEILKEIYQKSLYYLPKSLAHKIYYYRHTGKKLDLKNPKDFNEKIQYLMVYKYREKYGNLADKYLVRDYIKSKGYEDLLPKLYGIYDRAEDIDINSLPNQFVLKTNHGSGGIFICTDKKTFDINNAKKELDELLKQSFSKKCLEYHYDYIKPKIICEEYLKDKNQINPTDYKFYCYDGHVECMLLCSEREKSLRLDYYDLDWNYLDYAKDEFKSNKKHNKPKKYKEMIQIAKELSKGFAFVRVDLYEINGKIYFGELTFTPYAGVINYNKQEALDYLGSLMKIDDVKKE